jgi:hypothetical protein
MTDTVVEQAPKIPVTTRYPGDYDPISHDEVQAVVDLSYRKPPYIPLERY